MHYASSKSQSLKILRVNYHYMPLYSFLMFRRKKICFVSGATLAIILKVPLDPAVVISAMIAIFYTWIGTYTAQNIVQILKKKNLIEAHEI